MKSKTRSLAVLLAIVVATTAYAGRFTSAPGNGVPDRYIVVLEKGVAAKPGRSSPPGLPSVAQVAKGLAAAHGGDVLEAWEYLVPAFVVRMPEARARQLARDHRVASVVQDFTVSAPVQPCASTTSTMSNPPWSGGSPQLLTCSDPDPSHDTGSGAPLCRDNWGLDQIGDIRNDQLFHFANIANTVHAYVMDTGIRYDHVEFTGRIGAGKNVTTELTDLDPSPPSQLGDCYGHGTHVAAILGGRTFGVAKNITLHPVKVDRSPEPGDPCPNAVFPFYYFNIARGFEWIAHHVQTKRTETAPQPYPALVNWSGGNLSNIGTRGEIRPWVEGLLEADILLVQSAGNREGTYNPAVEDACNVTVGGEFPGTVVAGGTDYNQGRWVFGSHTGSNTGSCVDIWAPAANVISAWINANNGICQQSGTSMAAPHVAGVAALYLQNNPTAKPAEVERALRSRGTWNLLQSNSSSTNFIGPHSDNVFLNADTLSVGPDTAPVASFTVSCPGLQCTFDATASSADTASWEWTFGDGTTGTGAVVRHSYAQTGTYKVVLEVRDSTTPGTGKTDHLQQPAVVSVNDPPPTAFFTDSCTGLTCTFDSSASTDVSQRTWSFGDGASATAAVVTHTYAAEGTFDVVLTVSDANSQIATYQKTIVLSCPKPVFSFVTPSTIITAGSSISLVASTTVAGSSFQWYEGAPGDTSTPIGSGGSVSVSPAWSSRYWVRATNGCGATDSNAVNIGVTAATSFYTITPCRIMDSRGGAALAHDETRNFPVSGLCGIPAGTRAVAANVIAVAPLTTGFLAFRPAGTNWAGTSTMNYRSGQTRANNAILSLSSTGHLTVYNNGATQDFIVDVNGYFK